MKKNVLKYAINIGLFVDICSIAVIGLLLGFIIPTGRGAGAFLGLHRYDWRNLHLNLSLLLFPLLALHLWLNWTWIMQSTRRYFGAFWKAALYTIAGAWIVVIMVWWAILAL